MSTGVSTVLKKFSRSLLLDEIRKMNALLERLCEGVERLTPPAPDTEVSIDFVEEVPDLETEEKDESAALEEFEREQQEEYEEGILAMTPVEYERFVRSTGSDPRKRIVESRRKRGKSNGQ